VPAKLLEFAGINREVSIIGVRNHIEIWDRGAWADYQSRLEEEADATADELAAS
jgi:MraZ protein